jgi:hypothetical protein
MTSLAKLRRLRVLGFALGAVAIAGAAVLVTASAAGLNVGFRPAASQHPDQVANASVSRQASASAVCNTFISHLSIDLGKSQAQVNAAIQKAIGETLADEVKNKDITQAQADSIKQKLASQPPCTLAGNLGKKQAPAPGAGATTGAYMQQLVSAAASALGISDTTLKADLANGMTLSQIASAQNPPVTEAQFRSRLIAKLKPLLDSAVTSKKLTAAQEQTILTRLQTGPIPFWSTPMRRPITAAPASPATV